MQHKAAKSGFMHTSYIHLDILSCLWHACQIMAAEKGQTGMKVTTIQLWSFFLRKFLERLEFNNKSRNTFCSRVHSISQYEFCVVKIVIMLLFYISSSLPKKVYRDIPSPPHLRHREKDLHFILLLRKVIWSFQ